MQSRVLKRFARFESDWTFRESVISLIYHQRTAKAKTTNRSFLDVIFMSEKKSYGDSSKTVFREVSPFHLLEVY